MYLLSRRGHEESLALVILALIAVSEAPFVYSKRIRSNQSQLSLLQQTRAHSYARPHQLCDLDLRIFKVQSFCRRGHQVSGTETCMNLALVGICILWIN